MAGYRRNPRQGEYARKILSGIRRGGADSDSPIEPTSEPYIPPETALETGISVLHKYRPLGNLPVREDGTTATRAAVQLIEQRYLYAASPPELNDVFEIRLRCGEPTREEYRRFLEEVLQPLKQTRLGNELVATVARAGELTNDELELLHRASLQVLEEQWRCTRIISLSAKGDDPLMWAHYAASHTGICLGFAVRPGTMFSEALQVVYHDSPPLYTLGSVRLEEIQEAATLGKHSRWRHEDEWRILVSNRDPSKTPRLWQYDIDDLSQIVFGLRVDKDAEREVRRAAVALPRVRFGRMRPAERRDELEMDWD